MKNVIVTGGKGQLASCIKELIEKDKEYFHFNEYNFHFVDIDELDITDADAIDKYMNTFTDGIYAIINCAAYTNVGKAETDYDTAWKVNAMAPKYLAMEALMHKSRLIHISTDFVAPGSENTPLKPYKRKPHEALNVYGRTKSEGESNIMEAFGRSKNYVIVRTAWLYSEYGKNFCKTILNKVKNGEECSVVYDQVGSPTYAMDLARFLIYRTLDCEESKIGRIYHYSNEGVASWYDFAKVIEMAYNDIDMNKTFLVKPVLTSPTDKVRRPPFSVMDKTETCAAFDIEIPNWIDSVKECVGNIIEREK